MWRERSLRTGDADGLKEQLIPRETRLALDQIGAYQFNQRGGRPPWDVKPQQEWKAETFLNEATSVRAAVKHDGHGCLVVFRQEPSGWVFDAVNRKDRSTLYLKGVKAEPHFNIVPGIVLFAELVAEFDGKELGHAAVSSLVSWETKNPSVTARGRPPRQSKTQLCIYVYGVAEIGGHGFPCFSFTTEQVLNYVVKRGSTVVKRVQSTLWKKCTAGLWGKGEERGSFKSKDLVEHLLQEARDRKIEGFVLSRHHWGASGSEFKVTRDKYGDEQTRTVLAVKVRDRPGGDLLVFRVKLDGELLFYLYTVVPDGFFRLSKPLDWDLVHPKVRDELKKLEPMTVVKQKKHKLDVLPYIPEGIEKHLCILRVYYTSLSRNGWPISQKYVRKEQMPQEYYKCGTVHWKTVLDQRWLQSAKAMDEADAEMQAMGYTKAKGRRLPESWARMLESVKNPQPEKLVEFEEFFNIPARGAKRAASPTADEPPRAKVVSRRDSEAEGDEKSPYSTSESEKDPEEESEAESEPEGEPAPKHAPAFDMHLTWRIRVKKDDAGWSRGDVYRYLERVVFALFDVWRAFVVRGRPVTKEEMPALDEELQKQLFDLIDAFLHKEDEEDGQCTLPPGLLDALRGFIDWGLLIERVLGVYTLKDNRLRMDDAMMDGLFSHFSRPSSFDDIDQWLVNDTLRSCPRFTAAAEALWAAVRAA
jgi:hypothetical protein